MEANETYKDVAPVTEVEVDSVGDHKGISAPTQEEVEDTAEETGLIPLNSGYLAKLSAAGMEIEVKGAIRVANGFSYFSQTKIAETMQQITDAIQSDKCPDPVKAAYCLGYLANSMAKNVSAMKSTGQGIAIQVNQQNNPTNQSANPVRSFPASKRATFPVNDLKDAEEC